MMRIVRTVLGLLVGLAVGGVAFYLLGVKPGDALRDIGGVSPWAIVGCIGSSFVVLALQSLRWHSVMGPLLGLRYGDAFRAQVIGLTFSAVLPARGGDLLRVQYLGKRTGKSRATILGTEIVDRWLDWWGWIPTFLVLCLVTSPPYWLYEALGVFCALLTAWGAFMIIVTRRGWKPKTDSRLGRIWGSLRVGIDAFRAPRTWLIAMFIAPLPWLWETFVITLVTHAFGMDLSAVQAFSVMIAFNLAMVVPSPGSVGTLEAGGVAALVFFHIDQSRALAFQLVYHLTQLLPGIVTGIAILIAEGEKIFGRKEAPPEVDPGDQADGVGVDARRLDSLGQTSQSASASTRSE